MSDSRRSRRPDSRQMWDESDRSRRPRERDRFDHERDSDRPRHRSGSLEKRTGYDDRSRSPHRRYRDRGGRGRGRSGQDRSPRDSRRYDDRERDRPQARRRSASPTSTSPPAPSNLPTRSRSDKPSRAPASNLRRSPSSRDGSRDDTPMANEGDAEPGADDAEDDDMAAMQAMMGFGDFGTTKGKKVAGNSAGAVRKEKKLEYRQYMNRQGGFNRPLSPGR